MLSGIPDGSLPDTLASIVKASYLEKLEVIKLIKNRYFTLTCRSVCKLYSAYNSYCYLVWRSITDVLCRERISSL